MISFSSSDRQTIRDLAQQVADIADLPVMATRRAQWIAHNALRSTRPMMLVFPEGAWEELLPDSRLTCEGRDARSIEFALRRRIYSFAHFHDDAVIEKEWDVAAVVSDSDWGLHGASHASTEARGAWGFAPVLHTAADIKKIHFPEVIFDEQATEQSVQAMQALFGDILRVRYVGVNSIGFHLLQQYSTWRGLTETLMDFVEEPRMVHDVMALLVEGHQRRVQQLVELNLLRVNNDNTYCGSGGNSYTDELPAAGFAANRVRTCDMWACAESQEMSPVSPAMHREFAMAYERQLLEPFGLTAYGCCEDLTNKLDDVLQLPHIRRISIAPWANVAKCAEKLQDRYIFSWKPQPAYLCGDFDEAFIRAYVRNALDKTRGTIFEMVLKDTHTCQQHPERFDAWTRIARELIEETDEISR
jgi:hypothetical protein